MPEYPVSYPSYRFFRDGRAIVVQNQTEFDALEAGHSGSPAGPFPESEQEPGGARHAPEGERLERPVAIAPKPPDASGLTAELAEIATAERAVELAQAGHSQQAIAEELGVSRYQVRQWLREP